MKPLLLKISAFGSYAAEEVIDFTKLERGIFLITGDTGAGKTTIFDAMTFALYDQTSGGKRDTDDMRSQYAAPDTPTYVEFTFSIKGETYRIKRNPRYYRTSKRRDKNGNFKLTVESPLVELYLPGDILFTGKMKETNDKIIEIMGLDANQFKQICMLAQGDFLKLLHAPSSTRREIFARLFHTQLYERIELKLHAHARQLEKKLFESDALCIHELACIEPMQNSPYKEEWQTLSLNWDSNKNTKYLPMQEIEAILTKIVEEIDSTYRRAGREVICLEETVKVEKALEEKMQEMTSAQEKITTAETFLLENKENLTVLENKMKQAQNALLEQQKPLLEEIIRLQDAMPKYEKQKQIHVNVRKLQEECKRLGDEIAQRGIHFLVADTKEELLHQEADLDRELKGFLDKQQDLLAFEKELFAFENAEKRRKNAAEQVLLQLQKYEEASQEYEQWNHALIKAQVGIIASTLKENEPCPVCGSLQHPSPAIQQEGDITESKVKEAKKKRNQEEALLQNKQQLLQEAQLDEKMLSAQITQKGEKLFDRFYINKAKEQCQTIREIWAKEQKGIEECKKLLKAAQQMASLLEENTLLVSQLPNEDYLTAKTKLSKKQEILAQMQKTAKEAEASYQKLQQEVLHQKGAMEIASEFAKEMEQELQALRQQLSLLLMQNQLAGILLEEGCSYFDQYKKAKDEQQQMLLLKQKNQASYAQIKQLFLKRKELIQQYEMIAKLDKTANGNVPGAIKMDFQTFIQRYYFKKIILEANKRLVRMTNQQFILKCKELEDIGTQGAAGLDLNVYSLVTDSTRDVKTLSGGESFMAALAMALGMSDIISASVGKLQIETMFVDEGFGSLDEESRNQAIMILKELAGNKRLIGIISHVTELKEQIDNKLIVRKTDRGSSVIATGGLETMMHSEKIDKI